MTQPAPSATRPASKNGLRPSAPSTQWKEVIGPDEKKLHAQHVEAFAEVARIKSAKYGKGRLLHRQSQLNLHGSFEVLADLPDCARHGLFATPGTHETWVRLSNGGMDRASDKRPDIRGFSIKVRGLKGPSALGSGDTDCQDFLLINRPGFSFANSKNFVGFVLNGARGPKHLLKFVYQTFGLFGGIAEVMKLAAGMKTPFTGFATQPFFSATPIACGPYAARVRLQQGSHDINPDASEGWAQDFEARLAKKPLRFNLQLQFFVDEQRTPIEDATHEWPEDVAPFVTVGVLTIPKQKTASALGKKWTDIIEAAAFDPWAALMAHRPLGEVMRARKVTYFKSQTERR